MIHDQITVRLKKHSWNQIIHRKFPRRLIEGLSCTERMYKSTSSAKIEINYQQSQKMPEIYFKISI